MHAILEQNLRRLMLHSTPNLLLQACVQKALFTPPACNQSKDLASDIYSTHLIK